MPTPLIASQSTRGIRRACECPTLLRARKLRQFLSREDEILEWRGPEKYCEQWEEVHYINQTKPSSTTDTHTSVRPRQSRFPHHDPSLGGP